MNEWGQKQNLALFTLRECPKAEQMSNTNSFKHLGPRGNHWDTYGQRKITSSIESFSIRMIFISSHSLVRLREDGQCVWPETDARRSNVCSRGKNWRNEYLRAIPIVEWLFVFGISTTAIATMTNSDANNKYAPVLSA